ncbi:MAG: hypothetical protein H6765_06465 [Candidatus Peribacteria bacterium]|nr:MAG: hypothetical protein H6765_06465 [Candidatus Peribacteria bacterium]
MLVLISIGYKIDLMKKLERQPVVSIESETTITPPQKVLEQPQITNIYSCTDDGIKAIMYAEEQVNDVHIVPSSCLGPNGKAYEAGTQLTFYQLAYKAEDLVDPSCNTMTKTCQN